MQTNKTNAYSYTHEVTEAQQIELNDAGQQVSDRALQNPLHYDILIFIYPQGFTLCSECSMCSINA